MSQRGRCGHCGFRWPLLASGLVAKHWLYTWLDKFVCTGTRTKPRAE